VGVSVDQGDAEARPPRDIQRKDVALVVVLEVEVREGRDRFSDPKVIWPQGAVLCPPRWCELIIQDLIDLMFDALDGPRLWRGLSEAGPVIT
jgi:hypothetical protein